MKIAIDISQAQYQGTGVATYTSNLVQALLGLNSDHHFLLFASAWSNRAFFTQMSASLEYPITIIPLPPTLFQLWANQLRLPPLESMIGTFDLLHSSDWTQPPTRTPYRVTTVHDITTTLFPEYHHAKTISVHNRKLNLIAKENVHIITDAHSTKTDLVSTYKLPTDRISVVPLAPSTEFTQFAGKSESYQHQQISRVKSLYSLNQYFLSLGTREPRKNLPRLIQAYSQLRSSHPDLPDLVIAGKLGWGDLNLNPSTGVVLVGFVPNSHIAPLMAGAQGFLYPSLYEGFGLPVLEAMTLSVPVLTSQNGSLAEVAGTGAIIIDPTSVTSIAHGIENLLQNSSKLKKLGRLQAAKFTWEKTARQTLSVYQRLSTN